MGFLWEREKWTKTEVHVLLYLGCPPFRRICNSIVYVNKQYIERGLQIPNSLQPNCKFGRTENKIFMPQSTANYMKWRELLKPYSIQINRSTSYLSITCPIGTISSKQFDMQSHSNLIFVTYWFYRMTLLWNMRFDTLCIFS